MPFRRGGFWGFLPSRRVKIPFRRGVFQGFLPSKRAKMPFRRGVSRVYTPIQKGKNALPEGVFGVWTGDRCGVGYTPFLLKTPLLGVFGGSGDPRDMPYFGVKTLLFGVWEGFPGFPSES
jgi:hypothetical protein